MRAPFKKMAIGNLPPSPSPLHYYSELTVRERRFVDGYVMHLDPHRAQKDAGYNKVNVYVDLMRDERICCAIRERTEAICVA